MVLYEYIMKKMELIELAGTSTPKYSGRLIRLLIQKDEIAIIIRPVNTGDFDLDRYDLIMLNGHGKLMLKGFNLIDGDKFIV
jgi:hypothetical protein